LHRVEVLERGRDDGPLLLTHPQQVPQGDSINDDRGELAVEVGTQVVEGQLVGHGWQTFRCGRRTRVEQGGEVGPPGNLAPSGLAQPAWLFFKRQASGSVLT